MPCPLRRSAEPLLADYGPTWANRLADQATTTFVSLATATPRSTLPGVPDDESVLVVPLRANAHSLLVGAPVAALRQRLKFASLFYDRLYLESGIYTASAGPNGSSGFVDPPTEAHPARWQTPAERHAQTGDSFIVLIEGRVAVSSEASISWSATLHPFADELPPGANWVDFVASRNPTGEVQQLAQRWTWEDQRNDALESAIPIPFVRNLVIGNANRDLVLAVAAGAAVTIDRLHGQVVAQRFNDDGGWKLRGYAVPILFPHVGDLPWTTIADLRREREMVRFRAVLREVETEAMAEAANGDIEAAAHHAYERHLAAAVPKLEGIIGPTRRAVAGLLIGGGTGFATSGIAAPGGILAGAALGTAVPAIIDIRKMIRQRRSRGWVSVHQRISAQRGPG